MSLKDYIEMKPKFTEDANTNSSAPTAPLNSFSKMVNYIPKRGHIESRKGIVTFSHTPDISGSIFDIEDMTPGDPITFSAGNNPTDYAIIQAILPFNTTVACALGTNLLDGNKLYMSAGQSYHNNESGTITGYAGDKVEGTHSLIMTDNTANNTAAGEPNRIFGMRTANDFEEWMPGHSSHVTSFMITYWVNPERADGGANSEVHFFFGSVLWGTAKQPWYMRHFDQSPQWACSNQVGGNLTQTMPAGTMVPNVWQFMAAWHDWGTGFRGFYHYNKDTMVETYTASTSPGNANYYYVSSSYNTINADMMWNATLGQPMPNGSNAYHGLMDYMTMWSKPMHLDNSSNLTLVRYIRDLHA